MKRLLKNPLQARIVTEDHIMPILLPPDYPSYPVHCTGSACTFERHTSKKVCNKLTRASLLMSLRVALKRDRPALPSRSPATQPLISSCTGAVMSDTSRGASPDPTKIIVPSNRPARFAFAPAGGFFWIHAIIGIRSFVRSSHASPSAVCGRCPAGTGAPGRAGIFHSIYPLQGF